MPEIRTINSGTYGRFEVRRVNLKSGETGYSLDFAYDKREVGRIRKIDGAKWLQGSKVWFIPTSSDTHLAAYLALEIK
jgi:hypothetical protein